MTGRLQGPRQAPRRLRGLGGAFQRERDRLLEQYRCSACDGTGRELTFGPLLMGPYYRKCRGCDGRGWRSQHEEG